tara:strand:- start:14 stop:385 length:372 start_codon:yes stop_codon:yes gene_type:complete
MSDIRYILQESKDPEKGNKIILEFLSLIFGEDVSSWDEINGKSISTKKLKGMKVVKEFNRIHMQDKLKTIFRTSDIQKLRQSEMKTIKDIVTILRSIVRYYNFAWKSYYLAKNDTIYIITTKK